MRVLKWLKELFKKKELFTLAPLVDRVPLTKEQLKLRKAKRVAQRVARKRNRR